MKTAVPYNLERKCSHISCGFGKFNIESTTDKLFDGLTWHLSLSIILEESQYISCMHDALCKVLKVQTLKNENICSKRQEKAWPEPPRHCQ